MISTLVLKGLYLPWKDRISNVYYPQSGYLEQPLQGKYVRMFLVCFEGIWERPLAGAIGFV